ncbi:MAG: Hsp20/alpha crystallin family protein [Bacteroidota bacterium]|nr:Hsp20/alpha crystallin family protein [Bacteroidota bacterium]
MLLIKRDPTQELSLWNREFPSFRGLQSLQYDMNRIFDDFFRGDVFANDSFFSREWNPAVDIVENNDSYILKAGLPGMNKDDVKITLENNLLTIRGEKKNEYDKKEGNYSRMERCYGSFERTFSIPGTIKSNEIDAQYKDGILTVRLPKAEETKQKKIDVNVK